MSLISFGDSDEELSSDVQSDVEPLLQHENPKLKELKSPTITNGSPRARSSGSPGPPGRQYRLTNMAAGAGSFHVTFLFGLTRCITIGRVIIIAHH